MLWLNRIGIILNFLAGFMLAPELLGVERIRKTEDFLEKIVSRTLIFSDILIINLLKQVFRLIDMIVGIFDVDPSTKNAIRQYYQDEVVKEELQSMSRTIVITMLRSFLAVLLMITILFIVVTYMFSINQHAGIIVLFIVLIYFYISGFTVLGEEEFSGAKNMSIQHFISPFIAFSLSILLPPLMIIIYFFTLIISFTNILIRFTLHKLQGDSRLRSILVWWGIIFFILGNSLQFAATFDSPQ